MLGSIFGPPIHGHPHVGSKATRLVLTATGPNIHGLRINSHWEVSATCKAPSGCHFCAGAQHLD